MKPLIRCSPTRPSNSDGAAAVPAGAGDPGARRGRSLLTLGPLLVLLALWLLVFLASGAVTGGPSGKRLGGDFAIFLGASQTLRLHGDPYDRSAVYRAERAMLGQQHLGTPAYDSFIRVGNPPVFFWLLEPLTNLPFVAAAWLWVGGMFAVSLAAFVTALRHLGWRRVAVPVAIFAAMPPTVLGVYYGNADAIVFAAVVGGLALARRFPVGAGMILALAWLKPQVALAAALIIVLFHVVSPGRTLAGFLVGSIGISVASAVTCGPHALAAWVGSLLGYSRQLSVQPDIASLSGLYVYSAPSTLRLALQVAAVCVALGLTLAWWARIRPYCPVALRATAWLWFVWFLATPFAHFHDEILLAVPVLALLGRDSERLGSWLPLALLYAPFLSLLVFPTTRFHTDLQSLVLVPFAVVLCWDALRRPRASFDRQSIPMAGGSQLSA